MLSAARPMHLHQRTDLLLWTGLDTHLMLLLDVLSDMFFNALFSEQDIDSERGVILEEIICTKTLPKIWLGRLFSSIYKGNSLSRPCWVLLIP